MAIGVQWTALTLAQYGPHPGAARLSLSRKRARVGNISHWLALAHSPYSFRLPLARLQERGLGGEGCPALRGLGGEGFLPKQGLGSAGIPTFPHKNAEASHTALPLPH